MAPHRNLLSRQQRDEARQSAPRPGRPTAPARPTALPPYQPPSLPLTVNARHKLSNLHRDAENRTYEKHLKRAIANISENVAKANDRWTLAEEQTEKYANKRAESGSEEKDEWELLAEERSTGLGAKVEKLTRDADKALREMIDYRMEMSKQSEMLQGVANEAVASAVASDLASRQREEALEARRASRRPRRQVDHLDDENEEDEEEPENDAEMPDLPENIEILSPFEILTKARKDYKTSYYAKDLRSRYASQNEYKTFKTIIHDARNPGDNPPPLPHPSTWFAEEEETSNTPASRRRRMAQAEQRADEENEEEDDEIQMTGAVSSLKCPLTLQTFKEPYSNHKCKHTFEKSAILEFHHSNAVAYTADGHRHRGRGAGTGPKLLKCPQQGCDAMLEFDDFYDDQIILRQVKRQAAQEAAEREASEMEEEEEEDVKP